MGQMRFYLSNAFSHERLKALKNVSAGEQVQVFRSGLLDGGFGVSSAGGRRLGDVSRPAAAVLRKAAIHDGQARARILSCRWSKTGVAEVAVAIEHPALEDIQFLGEEDLRREQTDHVPARLMKISLFVGALFLFLGPALFLLMRLLLRLSDWLRALLG